MALTGRNTDESPLESVRHDKRTVAHLVKCEKKYISYANVIHFNDVEPKQHRPPVPPDEVVLCVDIYNPMKVSTGEKLGIIIQQSVFAILAKKGSSDFGTSQSEAARASRQDCVSKRLL